MTERAGQAWTGTEIQPVIVQPRLSSLAPRENVCSIHSLIGEGREKLCKMFTSAIFAMNARQTGSSMLLGEQ